MSIDPRAFSNEKLEAPHPLPFVSRKALKRVKNPLPAPENCPYCEAAVRLVGHAEIYGGREFGDWPYVYLCSGDECSAYVGLHPATDIPLGTLANTDLRRARKENKRVFMAVIAGYVMSRTEAYQWLAEAMGIPVAECHWGWFDIEQCELAGRICAEELEAMA